MKQQLMTIALTGILTTGSVTITVAQQQSENRLKAISTERYEPGVSAYVPVDSFKYNWNAGEGAGSADFHNFQAAFWGWYFQEPVSVYNQTGTIIKSSQQMQYSWNEATNQFDEAYKSELTFNAEGLITKNVIYQNDVGNWKQIQKANHTYQSGRLTLQEFFQSPDGVNWENSSKGAFSYYASGDLKTYITYEGLINNQWLPQDKKTFIYSNGLRTQETTIKWDDITDEWETHPYSRYDYNYNSNDLCDTATYSQWSPFISALILMNKHIYKYNTNGFLIEIQQQDDNNAQDTWRTHYKKTYAYNYSYPEESIGYRWNDQNSEFDNDVHHQFTFDGELLSKIEAQKWDKVSASWEPDPHSWFGRKTMFFYESIDEGDDDTGIKKVTQQINFTVYPNPASDNVIVHVAEGAISHIQITNINGQVVFQNKETIHADNVTIPVSQLAQGLYFLQIKSGGQKGVKSFAVK